MLEVVEVEGVACLGQVAVEGFGIILLMLVQKQGFEPSQELLEEVDPEEIQNPELLEVELSDRIGMEILWLGKDSRGVVVEGILLQKDYPTVGD